MDEVFTYDCSAKYGMIKVTSQFTSGTTSAGQSMVCIRFVMDAVFAYCSA